MAYTQGGGLRLRGSCVRENEGGRGTTNSSLRRSREKMDSALGSNGNSVEEVAADSPSASLPGSTHSSQ
jgi:hypothetical protein